MKAQVQEEMSLIEEKLKSGLPLDEADFIKLLTLKLMATKDEH